MTPSRKLLPLAAFVLVLVAADRPRTEVSASVDEATGEVKTLSIITEVIDSPDPFDLHWTAVGQADNRIPLNPQGDQNQDGPPASLLHVATGTALVIWSQSQPADPGSYDIVSSRFENGTSWTEPVAIASSPQPELDPFVLTNPADGSVHLLYWIDDATPRVVHRQASPDLTAWSAETQVSAPNQVARRPAAAFHDGVLHVVYEAWDQGFPTTPRQIVVASWDGQGFQSTLVATTPFGEPNWPQIHSKRSRLWIDWVDADGELAWTRETQGGWQPVQIEPYSGVADLKFHARGRVQAQVLDPAP